MILCLLDFDLFFAVKFQYSPSMRVIPGPPVRYYPIFANPSFENMPAERHLSTEEKEWLNLAVPAMLFAG